MDGFGIRVFVYTHLSPFTPAWKNLYYFPEDIDKLTVLYKTELPPPLVLYC